MADQEAPTALFARDDSLSDSDAESFSLSGSDEDIIDKVEHRYQPLKDIVYHNNVMLAPDGRMLCRCATKKVQWYLSRNLAVIESQVRLFDSSLIHLVANIATRRQKGPQFGSTLIQRETAKLAANTNSATSRISA